MVMTCGVGLFALMRWYPQQAQWSPPGDEHRGTIHIELALDFEAATGVPLKPPGVTGKRTPKQKGSLFQDAARRTAELRGGREAPGGEAEEMQSAHGTQVAGNGGLGVQSPIPLRESGDEHPCCGQDTTARRGWVGSESLRGGAGMARRTGAAHLE